MERDKAVRNPKHTFGGALGEPMVRWAERFARNDARALLQFLEPNLQLFVWTAKKHILVAYSLGGILINTTYNSILVYSIIYAEFGPHLVVELGIESEVVREQHPA